MPLAAQALLPFLTLLGAAAIVQRRPRRRSNGWIASAATGTAGIIALVELLRLAPGEHVDVPYLTTFPYADLAIRLDGLSLGFASVTLITAALLMLARLRLRGDRRDPWFGWLLTTAAACAVIFADNHRLRAGDRLGRTRGVPADAHARAHGRPATRSPDRGRALRGGRARGAGVCRPGRHGAAWTATRRVAAGHAVGTRAGALDR